MGNPLGETIWELPPLILHPFSENAPPSVLLENSKAALMLAGVIPADGSSREELSRRVLHGRHCEIRMLFYLGKDVMRWVEQCAEWASRTPPLASAGVTEQSFAGLLTERPPACVREKLTRWGVLDYTAIFSRATGLQAMFAEPPGIEILAAEFLRNYQHYADAAFRCYMASQPHLSIGEANFRFEIYASGEYSKLLENEWAPWSGPAEN